MMSLRTQSIKIRQSLHTLLQELLQLADQLLAQLLLRGAVQEKGEDVVRERTGLGVASGMIIL